MSNQEPLDPAIEALQSVRKAVCREQMRHRFSNTRPAPAWNALQTIIDHIDGAIIERDAIKEGRAPRRPE